MEKVFPILFLFLAISTNCCKSADVSIEKFTLKSISTAAKASWDVSGPDVDQITYFSLIYGSLNETQVDVNVPLIEKKYLINDLTPEKEYFVCVVPAVSDGSFPEPTCDTTNTSYTDPKLETLEADEKNTSVAITWTISGEKDDVKNFNITWSVNDESFWFLTSDMHDELTDIPPDTDYKVCVNLINVVDSSGGSLCHEGTTSGGNGGGEECPKDFILIGSKCYHIDILSTWIEARTRCEELSLEYGYVGDLAILSDFGTEFSSVIEYMHNNNYHDFWIGAFDLGHEGTWKWVDGTLLDLQSSHWNCNHPTLDEESNCAIITDVPDTAAGAPITRSKLIDNNCHHIHRALCQLQILKV